MLDTMVDSLRACSIAVRSISALCCAVSSVESVLGRWEELCLLVPFTYPPLNHQR